LKPRSPICPTIQTSPRRQSMSQLRRLSARSQLSNQPKTPAIGLASSLFAWTFERLPGAGDDEGPSPAPKAQCGAVVRRPFSRRSHPALRQMARRACSVNLKAGQPRLRMTRRKAETLSKPWRRCGQYRLRRKTADCHGDLSQNVAGARCLSTLNDSDLKRRQHSRAQIF